MTSEQHPGQRGWRARLCSSLQVPPLIPTGRLPVEGAALAGCLPLGQEVKPVRCSTCDPSSSPPAPSPVPSCKEIHTAWGLSQVSALLGQWLSSQEKEAPGTWAGRWRQPWRSPPGPPVPAAGERRSCPPVAWQVQAVHSCLGERTTESCVPET